MELEFENINDFKIEKLDKINLNKNLSIYNTKFLIDDLKWNVEKQQILKEDLINHLNKPQNLLLETGTTKNFEKSNIENEFKSQLISNKSISKDDCIKESIKLFNFERKFDSIC